MGRDMVGNYLALENWLRRGGWEGGAVAREEEVVRAVLQWPLSLRGRSGEEPELVSAEEEQGGARAAWEG